MVRCEFWHLLQSLKLRVKIADVYLSMTSNASCEQLEEGQKKIPKAVSHSILYHKVIKKTIWLTFYKDYLIKQIDSMLPCVCQKDIKIWRHTRPRIVCHLLVPASQHNFIIHLCSLASKDVLCRTALQLLNEWVASNWIFVCSLISLGSPVEKICQLLDRNV